MRNACRQLAFLLLCTFLIAPMGDWAGAAGKQDGAKLGSYHAILIGIAKYDSFDSLSSPELDVEALSEVLKKDYGFRNVTLLTSKTAEEPTASNILRVVREKAESLTENDNLLVYYAGHGWYDKKIKTGYWIPANGKPNDATTWLRNDDITGIMGSDSFKMKSFVLIADSCYAGSMLRSIAIEPAKSDLQVHKLLELGGKQSRIIITSGGNEPVPDSFEGTSHSLFANYLLKGLQENEDHFLDIASLIEKNVKPQLQGRIQQVPRMSRLRSAVDEDGIFVLTKIGGKLPALPDDPGTADTAALAAAQNRIQEMQGSYQKLQAEYDRLQKVDAENQGKIRALRQEQENAQRKYETQLSDLKGKEASLRSDFTRLDELDHKNQADQKRLVTLLKDKESLSAEQRADMEKEQQRVLELSRQIETGRDDLRQREASIAQAQKRLELAEAQMKAKVKSEEEKIAELQAKAEAAAKKAAEDAKVAAKNKKSVEDGIEAAKRELEEIKQKILTAQGGFGDAGGRFVVLGDVVFDKKTKLMWLKNIRSSGKDYDQAQDYVTSLKVAEYRDWRLPSQEEWRSLIPKGTEGFTAAFPKSPFDNVMVSGYYWISSGFTGTSGINLGNGGITSLNKKKPCYVWPVRDASPEEITRIMIGSGS